MRRIVSSAVRRLRLGWLATNVTLQSQDVQASPVSVWPSGFGYVLTGRRRARYAVAACTCGLRHLSWKDCLAFSACASWRQSTANTTSVFITYVDVCQIRASSYSFSFRLNWSSFNLTKTPASPPLTRWTKSPSFAPKMTLKSGGKSV